MIHINDPIKNNAINFVTKIFFLSEPSCFGIDWVGVKFRGNRRILN